MQAQAKRSKSRRRHGTQFKQEVLAACDQPGASVAAVAQAFGLNANLVHQWRRGRGFKVAGSDLAIPCATVTPQAAAPFVELALPAADVAVASDIRIEVRRNAVQVSVSWPSSAGAQCAAWLRELLR